MYDIELEGKVFSDLAKLSAEISARIKQKVFHILAIDPRGSNCAPLKGKKYAKVWRYKAVKDYRVFYEINETTKTITIARIKHRSEAYREKA